MPDDHTLTIHFHRNDGQSERVPLTHGTVSEAATAIKAVVLYQRCSLYESGRVPGQRTHRDSGEPLRPYGVYPCRVHIDPINQI
jgi:hypothetical protein